MDEKLTNTINNICTVLGAALLLKPIVDEVAKNLAPELQKITAGAESLQALPEPREAAQSDTGEPSPEHAEIAEHEAREIHEPQPC